MGAVPRGNFRQDRTAVYQLSGWTNVKKNKNYIFAPHFHGKMLQKSYKIIQNLWKQGWNQRKGGMYDAIAMEKQTLCIAGSRGSCLRHGGLFRVGGGNVRQCRHGDDDTGGFGNYGED